MLAIYRQRTDRHLNPVSPTVSGIAGPESRKPSGAQTRGVSINLRAGAMAATASSQQQLCIVAL